MMCRIITPQLTWTLAMPPAIDPDFSSAPRRRFFPVTVPATFTEPTVLYIQADAVDGSSTISFTPWIGSPVANVPIYNQGKFDLALVRSIQATTGVSAMWGGS